MVKMKINKNELIRKIISEIQYNKKMIMEWSILFPDKEKFNSNSEIIEKKLDEAYETIDNKENNSIREIIAKELDEAYKAIVNEDSNNVIAKELDEAYEAIVYEESYNVTEEELDGANEDTVAEGSKEKLYVSAEEVLKKAELKQNSSNIITFSKNQKIEISTNMFISLKLREYLYSVFWVETVGRILDNTLNSDIYANRISDKKSTIFKPYFMQYSEFRDTNFKEMNKWIENDDTGLFVQLDMKRCFYNISISKLYKMVDKKLKSIKKESSENDSIVENEYTFTLNQLENLNKIIFTIIYKYNIDKNVRKYKKELGNEEARKLTVLPIGFLPSNVLANIYLQEIDNKIKEVFYPIKYGRYVDDIVFLIKTDLSNSESELKEGIEKIKTKINTVMEEIKKNNLIDFNEKKTIYFAVTKNMDKNYLKKFWKEMEKLASDSHMLIDPMEFENMFNSAYMLTKDISKTSDLFTIVKDKKFISRIIAVIYYFIFRRFSSDITEEDINLSKEFIKKFYESVDDELFINLSDYWYHIITLELISKVDLKKEKINLESSLLLREKKLQTLRRIEELSVIYGDRRNIFNFYKKRIEIIFSSAENSILKKVEKIFKYPKYKLKDNEFLLNYERDLNEIFLCLIKNEEGKSIIELFDKNERKVEKIFEKVPLPDKKDKIIIAQANMHKYTDREKYFKNKGKNLTNIDDVVKTLNQAIEVKADVLIYPEQGIRLEDFIYIVKIAKNHQILIMGGFDFIFRDKKVYNLAFAVVPMKVKINGIEYNDAEIKLFPKMYPAPEEYEYFNSSSAPKGIKWEIYLPDYNNIGNRIIEYRGIKHAIINCYEATSAELKYDIFKSKPHIIHMITNNKDVEYYSKMSENISRELMAITTITNYSIYGGVQVYSPYREAYKRVVSMHKGARNTHVDECEVLVRDILEKRRNNRYDAMKANPADIYYRNIKGEENC